MGTIFGGKNGTRTRIIFNEQILSDDPGAIRNGYITVDSSEDRLILEWSSGAGVLDPKQRDQELVQNDVKNGLVSPEAARLVYGSEVERS